MLLHIGRKNVGTAVKNPCNLCKQWWRHLSSRTLIALQLLSSLDYSLGLREYRCSPRLYPKMCSHVPGVEERRKHVECRVACEESSIFDRLQYELRLINTCADRGSLADHNQVFLRVVRVSTLDLGENYLACQRFHAVSFVMVGNNTVVISRSGIQLLIGDFTSQCCSGSVRNQRFTFILPISFCF